MSEIKFSRRVSGHSLRGQKRNEDTSAELGTFSIDDKKTKKDGSSTELTIRTLVKPAVDYKPADRRSVNRRRKRRLRKKTK